MSVDLNRVAALGRCVDTIIELGNLKGSLDEAKVEELIQRAVTMLGAEFSAEELEAAKRDITTKYQIYATPGQSLLADYDQEDWYSDAKAEIEPFFWTRYKNYLIDKKNFSPNIVSTLGEDTLDQRLMNYILNPKTNYPHAVMRRGLVIGDVQSGKTSTYIGFLCKAADAGYKVFILLTGTIESLRRQTQERVEEGFIGIDMTADTTGGKRVGVGEDNKPIKAAAVTTRRNDFIGTAKVIPVTLQDMNAVVFVIKKQKDVLTSLIDWLISLNADSQGKINIPMLMIDDEADNASINTSKSKEDPTTINKLIRQLANIFTISNYIGFTATPFANVFIDPETSEKMTTQDLFPEDFIFALPTPSDYIGPQSIFAANGRYHSQLEYITDAGSEEEDGYSFYFKHKKEWEDELPDSLTDAIYTFYLANAIRDLNGDFRAHRSMLINISRFIKVQKYIQTQVEEIHAAAYRSIKYNLSHNFTESMKDPILARIYKNWKKQYELEGFAWDDIVDTLYSSIENIQIKVVNSSRKNGRLEYPKNESLRVIAIGGLALSRGLTLEGLIISYFYRNTCTYDVLMQMGRWFGYRKGYDTLFRIWTHRSSAAWYAEIAAATELLKKDMETMHDFRMRPKDFGIRVRNDADDLSITAYNKMRNAKDEYEMSSYFGDIVETPYLYFNPDLQKKNYSYVIDFISDLTNEGESLSRINKRYLIQNVPKVKIVDFLKKIYVPRFSAKFNPPQIVRFLTTTNDPSISCFDVAFIEGNSQDLKTTILGKPVYKVIRHNCEVSREDDRLAIGQRGKLGGTNDGLTGIVDFGGATAEEIIESAKSQYRDYYLSVKKAEFPSNASYPSNTWFKFVEKRRPILLIYFLDVDTYNNQKKQIQEFLDAMAGTPAIGFALGFPKNDAAESFINAKYKVNKVYNWFEQDTILAEVDEE